MTTSGLGGGARWSCAPVAGVFVRVAYLYHADATATAKSMAFSCQMRACLRCFAISKLPDSDLRMHRLRTACGSRDLVLLLGCSARVVDRSVSSDGFRQKRYKLPVGCAIVWDHAAPSANDGESDAKRSKLTADDWHLWQRN